MRARRNVPVLACVAMLAGCGESGAPKATGATTEAANAVKAAAADGKAQPSAGSKGAPAGATADKAAPAGAAVDKTAPAGAAAGSAAATPGTTAAAAAGVKPTAPGEKPLWDGSAPDDVVALFPARKQPKEPLPEELQKKIRYKLRDVSKAPIALRDAIYLPREDGSAEVLAIYELSTYEDCVQRFGGSRKKARTACLPELQTVRDYSSGEDESTKVRLNRDCRNYGVVRASLAPREIVADDKRLKVATIELPQASCELRSLQQFFLEDIDRDERPELVIAATAAREVIEGQRRSDAVITEEERLLWVLDVGEALSEQFHASVGKYSPYARTVWIDLNRDERPDVVQIADCRRGDDTYEEEDRCDELLLDRTWYLYNREADRWEDDEAPPPKAKAATPADDKASDKTDDKAAGASPEKDKPAAAAAPAAGGVQ